MGDDLFVEEFLVTVQCPPKPMISLPKLCAALCAGLRIRESDLCSKGKDRKFSFARAMLVYLVKDYRGISLEEVGTYLGRHPTGLSRLAARLEKNYLKSPELAAKIRDIQNEIFLAETQMSECQA